MNIISVSGYMGSGSSAVTDLLSEYEKVFCPEGTYEYIFLHCPNGVFDLEDKILRGNNALRSDEAIKSFRNAMLDLYRNGRWWFAGYESKLSPEFMFFVDEFISSITTCTFSGFWYQQEKTSKLRYLVDRAREKLGQDRFTILAEELYAAYPRPADFYKQAAVFLDKVFGSMVSGSSLVDGGSLLLDQLFLPHNLHRLDDYFPDGGLRVVSVSRDPRDVYILNKYCWHPRGCSVPLPEEPEAFCAYYARMREAERPYLGDRVAYLQFEDMVLHYDETVKKLELFFEGSLGKHASPRRMFDPTRSMANVGVFSADERFKDEADYIAEHLPGFLYSEMDECVAKRLMVGLNSAF